MGLRVNYAAKENCGVAVIVLVSFLRGQLTNHGTPRTLRLPGRYQIAPVWWNPRIISAIGLAGGEPAKRNQNI
jgi:hypothetical protein